MRSSPVSARLTAIVVLPTPPFGAMSAIVFTNCSHWCTGSVCTPAEMTCIKADIKSISILSCKRLSRSLDTFEANATEEDIRKSEQFKKARNYFGGKIDRGELEPATVLNVTVGELLDNCACPLG